MTDTEQTRLVTEALAERDRMVASATAKAVAEAFAEQMAVRDQAVADATVKALADAGWLLQKPAETVVVKRFIRDDAGVITSVVERVEQVPIDD